MVDCLAVYDNDMIAVDDPETANTAVNMYETLVSEGHDARLLRFSPSDDGTIPGSHQDPKNTDFWKVGTIGKKILGCKIQDRSTSISISNCLV